VRSNAFGLFALTVAACSGPADLGLGGLSGSWSFTITTQYSNYVPDTSTSGLPHEGFSRSFGLVILVQQDDSFYNYDEAGRVTYVSADSVSNAGATRDSVGPVPYPGPGPLPLVKVRNDTIFNLYSMPLPRASRVSFNLIRVTFGLDGPSCLALIKRPKPGTSPACQTVAYWER